MKKELLKRDDYRISIDTDTNEYLLFEKSEKLGSYKSFEGANKAIDRKIKQEKIKPLEVYAVRGWGANDDYERAIVTSAKLEKTNYGCEKNLCARVTFKDGIKRKINLGSSNKIVKVTVKNEERLTKAFKLEEEIKDKRNQIKKIRETLEGFPNEEIIKYFKVAED